MRPDELLSAARGLGIVVAPKPEPGSVNEGWMSRIAAVERLLAGPTPREALPRLYLNPHHQDDRSPDPRIRTGSDGIVEACVDTRWSSQFALFRELVTTAPWVYVHTVHLARFLVPFLDRARVYVDVHGIAPEEEALYGNAANAAFFEEVERRVWQRAEGVVTVTAAMRDHLERKHGAREGRSVVLPIFEGGRGERGVLQATRDGEVPTVIYSGGAQRWQRVDDMVSLAAAVGERARWIFLSHEPHEFETRLTARGARKLAEVRSVRKDELEPYYLRSDYGLVLRDPIAVNRVSCPTKLMEYLKYGIVPVVDFAELGDFVELGYRAVTASDFAAGRLPDAGELEAMRQTNYAALDRLTERFEESQRALRGWFAGGRVAPAAAASRPLLEHLSTLELTSGATTFAALSEVDPSGTARHGRQNTSTAERQKRFALSGHPLRELRVKPVQGAFMARASGAAFVTADGAEIPARVDYRGARCTADLCVCTPDVPGEIVLTPLAAALGPLREAVVAVDMVAQGPEVRSEAPGPSASATAAPTRAIDVLPRTVVELLRRSRRTLRSRLGLSS